MTEFQRRTLRSLARANFQSVREELGRESLSYYEDDQVEVPASGDQIMDSETGGLVH